MTEASMIIGNGEDRLRQLPFLIQQSNGVLAFADIDPTKEHGRHPQRCLGSEATSGLHATLSLVGDAQPSCNLLIRDLAQS